MPQAALEQEPLVHETDGPQQDGRTGEAAAPATTGRQPAFWVALCDAMEPLCFRQVRVHELTVAH